MGKKRDAEDGEGAMRMGRRKRGNGGGGAMGKRRDEEEGAIGCWRMGKKGNMGETWERRSEG